MKKEVYLVFVGIDSWNRPVFRNRDKKEYYGATDILFSDDALVEEILDKVKTSDLTYFGNSFGCEPMGSPCPENEEWITVGA